MKCILNHNWNHLFQYCCMSKVVGIILYRNPIQSNPKKNKKKKEIDLESIHMYTLKKGKDIAVLIWQWRVSIRAVFKI